MCGASPDNNSKFWNIGQDYTHVSQHLEVLWPGADCVAIPIMLLVLLLLVAAPPASSEDIHSLIYDTLQFSPPFRILSNTGQIGYGSPEAGLVAPLFDGSAASALRDLVSHSQREKPAVVLAPELLSPSTIKQLRSVAAAVILPSRNPAQEPTQGQSAYPPEGFSPQETDPNRR